MPKRVLVGYGVDVDAVSGWLNTKTGAPPNLTDVSRGIFGATVGIDRVLKLFDKYGIKATFFVPAHTVESFPEGVGKIRDKGHEMHVSLTLSCPPSLTLFLFSFFSFFLSLTRGLHGYTHEHVSTLTLTQEKDVLAKSIEVITKFTGGKKPKGWTGPHWETSTHTIKLLEEFGLEYDHSYMHHDSQLYYLPYPPERLIPTTSGYPNGLGPSADSNIVDEVPASTWMKPMSTLKPSSIVEVPANWHLDDWPPLQANFKGAGSVSGFVDPHVVERMWKEQFDFYYREAGEERTGVLFL
ncbi:hypothetical protein D9758_014363 [Tetrapyrgos nigripes]|uniref:NodB homology domain-containing protein n=1 Tax=Tetrapyrgos nigripes TaxID=182062 RepID=A0A8H5C6W0_9AGAR|nr:hypothetical protein D9758_014363 [Tetrapyrgos nigripes]